MRLKYADLAKRHDDVLAKYMGIQEENKILRKLQNTPSNEVSTQVITSIWSLRRPRTGKNLNF